MNIFLGKDCASNLIESLHAMAKKPGRTVGIDRREIFIRHYLVHQNSSRAYREAGFQDGPGTRQSAHRLLTSAYIQARISEERQKLLATLDMKVEDITRRLRDIAFSDITEIVGYHFGACRYCYGTSQAYQWRTPGEYRAALSKSDAKPKSDADPEGGYGYCANQPPHPKCPMCEGEGIPHVKFKDTRLLTDSERAVFAGVERTRSGVRFHFHDRFAALKQLAIRLGFYSPVVDQEPNAIARLIQDLQARGQMQRMQLRRDHERGE